MIVRAGFLSLVCLAIFGQRYYTYVGNISADSVLLAWGTADGPNTIGRSSPSHGVATVKIADRTLTASANWLVAGNLKPDTKYPYQVLVGTKTVGQGVVRTWPATATRLVFFVIGDFGNGSRTEYAIAQAMWKEVRSRASSADPVRFIVTTGDNIYGDVSNFLFGVKNTGNEDSHWARKFFEPYRDILAQIPFYPTLGNHDGNETERHGDLQAYLDNIFFPGDQPARWYTFTYGGGLAQFFGLDSTMNTESGPPRPAYLEDGEQFHWMQRAIPASTAVWKIPYFHNPPFNAGPRHTGSYRDLLHWIQLFQRSGVKVVFNGHEHNFQFSQVDAQSGGIRFVTSGSGGQLRGGNLASKLRDSNMAGFAQQNQFLVVEIDGKTMHITPRGFEEIRVRDANGASVTMPLTVVAP
jgi:hypothetical protein